jgi:protoporphyrinogen oxidase
MRRPKRFRRRPLTQKTAIIIGAGPAGLTAARELLERTDIQPIVIESTDAFGGISRTVNYKGNRIDIGGHRFFSKSDRVMNWWMNILPLQKVADPRQTITYQSRTTTIAGNAVAPDPDVDDKVMLLRSRRSRIYFSRTFFDYPISLSLDTLMKLGVLRSIRIGFSYIRSALFPIKPEKNLEQFFINRFGRELYKTFFKSYTEKVWGVACDEISAEWGAQRVKGLSITKAIVHFVRSLFGKKKDIAQKNTETSLIEQFLYPKFGPGQMWEEVAQQVTDRGG